MSGKLVGKAALVTGTSKGIGASIAKHLAVEGASVVVNYASSRRPSSSSPPMTPRGSRAKRRTSPADFGK